MENGKIGWWGVGCIVVGLIMVLCFSVSYAQNKDKPDKDKLVTEETTWSPVYKDESIDIIAIKFGKQFDKKVLVSSSIKGKKISLVLTKATFDDVLKAITQPQGWQYIQDGDTVTFLTRDEYQAEMKQRVTTKTFAIKYINGSAIGDAIRPLLSTAGNFVYDERLQAIVVSDVPEVLANISQVIASIDIPTDTKIIPIRYSNPDSLVRFIADKVTKRGMVTWDKKSNLIISDIPDNLGRLEALVIDFENSARAIPQVNIDCSIIKVALNQKYQAGIDWTNCPFLARDIRTQSGVYLNNNDQNKLLDWLKLFGEPELISRKKTTVVPGNQASIREGSQYQVVVNLSPGDSTRAPISTRNIVDSGFSYTFTVQPTIDTKDRIIQLNYRVDGVLPESGNKITYQVSVDNTRIKDGYTLVTEDIRRLPIGSNAGIVINEQEKFRYGSMDLILLITPRILESEMTAGK